MKNEAMRMDIRLEVKALSEDGTFEGVLSAYDFVDYGGDSVEKGAFTKTLKESGGKVPLLWQHDTTKQIGVLELTDGDVALAAKGTLNMELSDAQQARSIMRFNLAKGLSTGLSIGFVTVKDSVEKGVRYLKELKLLEGSIVTLPMNKLCTVTAVKALTPAQAKAGEFADELEEVQAIDLKYQIMSALCGALDDAIYDAPDDATPEAISATLAGIIDDFKPVYLAGIGRYLAARAQIMQENGGWGWMSRPASEVKALPMGAKQLERFDAIINNLKALRGATPSTSKEAAAVEPEAAIDPHEPVHDHSLLKSQIEKLAKEIVHGPDSD